MAFKKPPYETTRLREILDPETGHYRVLVRLSEDVEKSFPDKPFNMKIEDLDLPANQLKKYEGFELTKFETMEGDDVYWVFEKLDGPVWDTKSQSRDNLLPAKWRGNVVKTKTMQDVVPGTELSALEGNLISSTVQREENTGRSKKVDITEEIDEQAGDLEGQDYNLQGALTHHIESLVVDGTEADEGPLVLDSRVTPLGNGKSIKKTMTADSEPLGEDNPCLHQPLTRLTPLGTDVMFVEVGVMPDPVPDYGSAHYDTTKWPNHKLSLIEPADEAGARYKFYYVADRANQDDYNYEIKDGEELVRTYLVRREFYREWNYAQWVVQGEDENYWSYPPAGVDGADHQEDGTDPVPSVNPREDSHDLVFTKYAFVDDNLKRVSKEFDSIYVTIQRRFIEPITAESKFDDQFERNVKVTKEIVAPGTQASAPVAGKHVEIMKGNVMHDVRITQELVLKTNETIPYDLPDLEKTQNHRFPTRLDSVELWGAWAMADSTEAAYSYNEDFFFNFRMTEPRPGPYAATLKRIITDDPNDIKTSYSVTAIPSPVVETIAIVGSWYNASPQGNSTFAIAKERSVPSCIHDEIFIELNGANADQSYYITDTLPASEGFAAFMALTEVVVGYETRKMAMGLYEVSAVVLDISGLYAGVLSTGIVKQDEITMTRTQINLIPSAGDPSTNLSFWWDPTGLLSDGVFKFYRAESLNGTFVYVGAADPTTGGFNDSGLDPNTSYWYKVKHVVGNMATNAYRTTPVSMTTAP